MPKKKTTKVALKKEPKVVPMQDAVCGWCKTNVDKVPVPFCSDECKDSFANMNV